MIQSEMKRRFDTLKSRFTEDLYNMKFNHGRMLENLTMLNTIPQGEYERLSCMPVTELPGRIFCLHEKLTQRFLREQQTVLFLFRNN